MKLRKIGALLLSLALLTLLAGCGGGENAEPEDDGRGDVIEQEPAPAPAPEENLPEEPEVNFEDFFGCWEYANFDIWVYIYGDGTYETFDENGEGITGSYTPEGTEIVLDSGDRFALSEDGGLIDGEGYTLFASELPEFAPEPYFEEHGVPINYAVGQGDATLEDGALYYESNTNGQYYNTGPLVCSIYLESEEELDNGYVERTYTLYRAFSEEDIPMFTIGVTMDASYLFYDYYSGSLLPDNEYFQGGFGEGSFYFEFESGGNWVDLYMEVESSRRDDVDGYRFILSETITVTAPGWYDGLVLSVPTEADTWEGFQERGEVFTALNDFYPALDLPWGVENALNCLLFQ